jgi:hypothetical protein
VEGPSLQGRALAELMKKASFWLQPNLSFINLAEAGGNISFD